MPPPPFAALHSPMPSTPFRCQVRLSLSDLDRNVYAQQTLATAQFADEPDEHVLLRFLAWAWFYEPELADAQGWVDQNQPDLWAYDLTGQLQLWVECGIGPIKRLCKALGRSKTARFVCLCRDEPEALALRKQLLGERPRHLELVELYAVGPAFVQWLESVASRNMNWTCTLSDATLYIDSDGQQSECQLQRIAVV